MTQAPDWELDYYSRPILEADGKKRWELLICSTPEVGAGDDGTSHQFRWVQTCPATSVNSIWLKEALEQALCAAEDQGFAPPRRLRCWRASMRTMVQRAAEGLGMELVSSRRTYALVSWLQERERSVYPQEPGYMAGPLAPPPQPLRPIAVPLPEAARGESWAWASLPLEALAGAGEWDLGFAGLVPLPSGLEAEVPVPGIRLFSPSRALALAGWLAGLEPVRLEISGLQLVLEAGMEDRWLLTNLDQAEAGAAARAFAAARTQAGGLQFMAVQANEADQRFEGFWLLRDLPDA
ncbi:Tab2/Atab2 family RNA-binding protein [Synechococcus sp. CBW1108]|uniref:Tab2/Atab2 family RNA-binding protein n=1 Tax=Synechococcus sp. CBW1108 TaxID=1353147 RepID=UPI0018CEA32B|nr:Tab2/Atab2 family RNA-binding protein [Synechococcus sp. CBW1108]QPN70183.1 Tab2/Atab2 family RNA-binding protein [Synechococcus sp. CBW1108]